jgi:hypothetical protein
MKTTQGFVLNKLFTFSEVKSTIFTAFKLIPRMKQSVLILILVIMSWLPSSLRAQPFSAYSTVRQEFYIFDNGMVNRIEPLIPLDYKIGRNAVAYRDNLNNFKIYKDGNVSNVSDLLTTNFQVTDNLLAYQNSNILSVMDGSDIVLLSRLCDRFALGDSVVLFYDLNKQTFNGYYQGKITELEAFLNLDSHDFLVDSTVRASDNIGAYISFNGQFKVFYNGVAEELENQPVKEFKLGRNTMAYLDINNIFKIYHKGQVFQADPFKPKSFMVGDDVVAFESSDGYFKIFHDGKLHTIGYYSPNYNVKDWVVAYEDLNGFFKVFYEGEFVTLDNYYPDKLDMSYRSLRLRE